MDPFDMAEMEALMTEPGGEPQDAEESPEQAYTAETSGEWGAKGGQADAGEQAGAGGQEEIAKPGTGLDGRVYGLVGFSVEAGDVGPQSGSNLGGEHVDPGG